MKIFIWGTGYIAEQVMNQYDNMGVYDIRGYIDNATKKQGKMFHGKMIYAPDILLQESVDKIIVLTDKFQEIYEQITESLKLRNVSIENKNFFYVQSILNRYKYTEDEEIKSVINYIQQNELQVFNYEFVQKYKDIHPIVRYDESCGLYYIMHSGKRMYFAKNLDTEEAVAKYYIDLLIEQDENSPHRYLDDVFQIQKGDIVVDAGVAEGNFALEVIDKISKLYLIEADDNWVEALRKTFEPYKDKVIILQKFLTSMDEGKYAMLDSLISEPVNFIKMDIEGNEWDALLGAKNLIHRSKDLQCAICAYHTDYDETLITQILSSYELQCEATRGYMWYPTKLRTNYVSTKLCRGIIRGIKRNG